jgi:hypothetical protein
MQKLFREITDICCENLEQSAELLNIKEINIWLKITTGLHVINVNYVNHITIEMQ